MSSRKNHIDKIYSRKLKHWIQEPPPEVWDHIRQGLASDRKKNSITWFVRIAASVAVITLLSLGYVFIRDSADRNLLTEEQSSSDSVLKETEQNNPAFTELSDKDEEERGNKENIPVKETYPDKNQITDEKKDILAEDKGTIHEKQPPSEVLDQPGEISGGSTLPGSELAYLEMNYILHLDYAIPQPERKPERYNRSGDYPVLTEPAKDADWNELFVENLPDQEDKNERKWAVGTQVSPIYSYRTLGVQETDLNSGSYYNEVESGMIAYSGGVNVNFLPTKRISIQSGIYYSKMGLSINHNYFNRTASAYYAPTSFYKYNSVSNSSGIIRVEDNSPVGYITNADGSQYQENDYFGIGSLNVQTYGDEIIQNFQYLEVPLIIRFKMLDRKLDFNFLGGLSTNFLVGSNAYVLEDGSKEKIGKTTEIKPVNYSSILGFGVDYAISKRLNINLEPTFRYYLNSINESSSVRSHPYSIGFFTGMSFYF